MSEAEVWSSRITYNQRNFRLGSKLLETTVRSILVDVVHNALDDLEGRKITVVGTESAVEGTDGAVSSGAVASRLRRL